MEQPLTPREAQRRTVRLVNYEDGLWDILLGLIFLALSVYPITRRLLGPEVNLGLFLVVLAVLVVGLTLVRRIVSAPRIGVVRMRRTRQKAALTVVLLVIVLATFGLVLATLLSPGWMPSVPSSGLPQWVDDLKVDIALTVVVIAVFSVMAYMFSVSRVYLYGWLIGLGNLASTALMLYAGFSFNLPLAVASGIIILIGVVLLVRFVRKYPLAEAEAENGRV
jgi:hypothetical protein